MMGRDLSADRTKRPVIYALVAAAIMLWLATLPYILRRSSPSGDGFEWVIQGPFAYALLLFVLPAFLIAKRGRGPAWLAFVPVLARVSGRDRSLDRDSSRATVSREYVCEHVYKAAVMGVCLIGMLAAARFA